MIGVPRRDVQTKELIPEASKLAGQPGEICSYFEYALCAAIPCKTDEYDSGVWNVRVAACLRWNGVDGWRLRTQVTNGREDFGLKFRMAADSTETSQTSQRLRRPESSK